MALVRVQLSVLVIAGALAGTSGCSHREGGAKNRSEIEMDKRVSGPTPGLVRPTELRPFPVDQTGRPFATMSDQADVLRAVSGARPLQEPNAER